MRFKKIIQFFEDGNVCVFGLRGRGKDMLMSNVVVRRKLPYISNIDYGGKYFPFDYNFLDCGKNTYLNFLQNNVNRYVFPYPDGTDVYLSDCGIYFPAQYGNDLDRKFPYLPVYQCLSRHLGQANFHCNAQSLSRIYLKIREQSDLYIMCRRCIYLHGLVLQWVTIYDQYDSACQRMRPLRLPAPLLSSKESRMMRQIQLATYEAAHGKIRDAFLIYRNKSSYNTRQFKEILEKGGVSDE